MNEMSISVNKMKFIEKNLLSGRIYSTRKYCKTLVYLDLQMRLCFFRYSNNVAL